ncbi:MAG: hypothetical protein LBD36_02090 [Holosporales bacterium]|jgi:hypothetical protein|nr:hypothetical protein [Holosporales bacterium]
MLAFTTKGFKQRSVYTLLLFLVSCTNDLVKVPSVGLKRVTVVAQKDANNSSVTTVHLVFPKTDDVYTTLNKMDAIAYFAAFRDLLASFPNDLEIVVIEAVPGLSVTEKICLKDFASKAVIVFASYDQSIPGTHRETLRTLCKQVSISLGRNSFTVSY